MSKIRVQEIEHTASSNTNPAIALNANNNVTFDAGVTATSFTGDGANLTNLPSANLTGAIPANLLTNAGGGGMEFVSKTPITVNNTTTQINLTGLDYNSLYKVVMKLAIMSGSGQPNIHLYLDGSINTMTIIDYVSNNAGYMQQLFQDQDNISLYTAGYDDNYWEYEIIFTTGYYGWFRTMQHPMGHSYPAGWGQCWGHLNPSYLSSKRISGLSLRHTSSRTFQIGTEVLLYKFKES